MIRICGAMIECLTPDKKVACLSHVGFISRFKDLLLWPLFCVFEVVHLIRDKKVACSIHV